MTITHTPATTIALELPDPYTALPTRKTIHLGPGNTTYRLDKPQWPGTITIQPNTWPPAPIPEGITLLLGDHDCATRQATEPSVNPLADADEAHAEDVTAGDNWAIERRF